MDKKRKRKLIVQIAGIALFLAACVAAVIVVWPHAGRFLEDPAILREAAQKNVFAAIAYFLVFQLLQIIVAFIPGEAAELAAGAAFGWFWGFWLCVLGIAVASGAIFILARKLGRSFIDTLTDGKEIGFMEKINNNKNRDFYIFLLFFIPGLPKDFFTYGCAFLDISYLRFLTISTIARIPSIISSTIAGAAVISDKMGVTIAIFVINGILALLGFLYKDKIMARISRGKELKKQ